jgi:hypothetical protein
MRERERERERERDREREKEEEIERERDRERMHVRLGKKRMDTHNLADDSFQSYNFQIQHTKYWVRKNW